VDIGCGTGLWLDLLDKVMPETCEFVGIDSDPESLAATEKRARGWHRPTSFDVCDIEREPHRVPAADLVLAFNVLPYLPGAAELARSLHADGKLGRLVVRQYDGSTIRLGPMAPEDRFAIDGSLEASLLSSSEFGHYEMDRAFALIRDAGLRPELVEFELIQRTAPFPASFNGFFYATIDWMAALLSDDARARLQSAVAGWETSEPAGAYFAQVDLVAVLSA
jgi:SAM-dependent methyltransferase